MTNTKIISICLIALIVMLSGCTELGGKKVITRYQCYDGNVVSSMSECPKPATDSSKTVATTVTTQTPTSGSTKCPTTVPCNCPGVTLKSTTTSTIKLGPLCTTDADCGQVTYGAIRCHNGDAYKVKNTPQCALEKIDGQNHCKTLSEQELSKECADTERCVPGQGCIFYKDE